MKTILVTGAAGFIGYHVSETLAKRGDRVIGIDNFNPYYDPALKRARAARLKDSVRIFEADITDIEALKKIFREAKIDQVCHLAAQAGVRYSLENPFAYEKTNLLGTLNLMELAKEAKIPSFIYASSSSVYGGNEKMPFSEKDPVDKPISLYAATKKANELMAYTYHHLYGMHVTGLRFFTVYGPWGRPDMALFKFTKSILKDEPIDVYNFGKMRRDFTYISDIVAGVAAALDKDYPVEVFNLGHSEPVELLYFIDCVAKELGKKPKMNLLPLQPGDVPETSSDISHAEEKLGFKPQVSVPEGIKEFVAWYKDYYKAK